MKMEGFAHVGLFVNDIQKSVAFYTETLGFKLIWESVNQCPEGDVLVKFVENGGSVIELVQFPYTLERKDGWFDHIAMNVKDIDAVMKALEEKGVEFEEGSYTHAPQTFPGGSKWVMFRGPDGEHLELNERL